MYPDSPTHAPASCPHHTRPPAFPSASYRTPDVAYLTSSRGTALGFASDRFYPRYARSLRLLPPPLVPSIYSADSRVLVFPTRVERRSRFPDPPSSPLSPLPITTLSFGFCGSAIICRLLDSNGAEPAETRNLATRIIVERTRFGKCARKKKEEGLKAILVTWVYSSVKAGNKRPPQYYSPDPSMFFSSVFMSAVRLQAASVWTEIAKYGGQWVAAITDDVTHLRVEPTSKTELDFPNSNGFHPFPVSYRWFLDCLIWGVLLPAAPVELSQSHEHDGLSFSAA
ncbi:hypothetical protein C8F04DRAFT_1271755 [Mycena alexandri]|uniref:BRCT domain-containing protein n=1 Tax=Mycena alexandri TaxID=1745969 RepID=A0AAD6WLK5_9AGAR|nr:hypothetical protein C8F04DRAFT_1277265 [Mycena alexandri]KAJ7023115.1 hypothetical protein C8F04DRAFT_1271755 [Mycena alexandri]